MTSGPYFDRLLLISGSILQIACDFWVYFDRLLVIYGPTLADCVCVISGRKEFFSEASGTAGGLMGVYNLDPEDLSQIGPGDVVMIAWSKSTSKTTYPHQIRLAYPHQIRRLLA